MMPVENLLADDLAAGDAFVAGFGFEKFDEVAGYIDRAGLFVHDEVYYLISGQATLKNPRGTLMSLLYVCATKERSFFEIVQDMTLLVFFATALRLNGCLGRRPP